MSLFDVFMRCRTRFGRTPATSIFAFTDTPGFAAWRPAIHDRAGRRTRPARAARPRAGWREFRHWRDAALGASLLFGVAACTWQGIKPDAAGPRRLYISGDTPHLSADRIALIAAPYLKAPFFDVDIQHLRARLAAEPWLARVDVSRHWPDGVVIDVAEHRPLARWGAHQVLAADGAIFAPASAARSNQLIQLDGPDDEGLRVYHQYQRLAAVLAGHDARIAALSLDARGAWRARLDSGLQLRLGRDGLTERIQRFVRFALGRPKARSALATAGYVDLRYSDGFAVGGRRAAPAAPNDQEKTDEQAA